MLRITTEEEWLACENPLELYECIKDRKDNHSFRWLAVEWGGYIRELYEEDNRKWFDAFASY